MITEGWPVTTPSELVSVRKDVAPFEYGIVLVRVVEPEDTATA